MSHCGKKLEMDGLWLYLSEWAELYGMPKKLVYQRVNVHRWSLKRALTEPQHKPTDKKKDKLPRHRTDRECKPSRIVDGCIYPDCFHCILPDCFSD